MSITGVVPYLHVASVRKSMEFYQHLGMSVISTHGPDGDPFWARLAIGEQHIMLAQASGPIDAHEQAVLLYMYADDLVALRAKLLESGLVPAENVFEIKYPFYMELGELRVHDLDGYVLLIGKLA